jgi:argininosuccinate lyase
MPQKRNPDVLELVRARHGLVVGAATQVRTITGRLTSGYHRDLQLLKEPLLRSLATVSESLAMMDRVMADLVVDEEALAASCSREIYAADLALEKAREGVPFRDAYRSAMAELEGLEIDPAFVAERIDAYRTVGSMGNPGLERYREPLAELAAWIADRQEQLQRVEERLRSPLP